MIGIGCRILCGEDWFHRLSGSRLVLIERLLGPLLEWFSVVDFLLHASLVRITVYFMEALAYTIGNTQAFLAFAKKSAN